ncbi:hypothetical protein Acy02nite_68360 [Actinoplanes cyaneus]|uniref:Capsid maturation protease n=1 Tax=Actinoplanes cyaneus TaxID=52696 RepID=A0A919IMT3_9ACTN|nr:hypothetical protein [Actinoplanes cyaneus]MCW2139115.1 hypothetical protein [Actinoplanes cyaneus]GID68955.1 hypothetical protein Acy02nite_68360 [Actinoplanes cyaneus]
MTPTLEQVADSYRQLQATLNAETAARVTVAFESLLDPADLDRTFPAYFRMVTQIIAEARRVGALVAGAFLTAYRDTAGVGGDAPAIAYAGQLPAAQLATSLFVTGPVQVKRSLAGGATIQTSISRARAATAGAVVRHTADAGRSTVRDTVRRDRVALGWARLTDGDPCYFCAMLAGRGAVYLSKDSATGDDPYHDGCGCVPVPVYSRAAAWPGRSREFETLWNDSTEGQSGRDAINAFRRAYAAQRKTSLTI